MRKLWLQDPETRMIWDLLPLNPYLTPNDPEWVNFGSLNNGGKGCAFLGIKGMGYKQSITQRQVDVDYFISEISSTNQPITGTLYFNGDKHVQAFQEYIGDFRKQFNLFYSPDGEFEPYDALSAIFRKPVTVSQIDKTEKNEFGWYECSTTFVPQSDVWRRDVYYNLITNFQKDIGEALVYPYKYEYVYGGRKVYSIDIPNSGREGGCLIKIKNIGNAPMDRVEWFIEHKYTDAYGREQETVQRSAWYFTDRDVQVTLQTDYILQIDSNDTTQEAKVIYPDGTSQSVVNWQEPSYDYINFVRIKHGNNKLVFYLTQDADIQVYFQEKRELI